LAKSPERTERFEGAEPGDVGDDPPPQAEINDATVTQDVA
jgi:hypothetical protein